MFALQKSGKSRIFADWPNCCQASCNHIWHVNVEHITFLLDPVIFIFMQLKAFFVFVIRPNLSSNIKQRAYIEGFKIIRALWMSHHYNASLQWHIMTHLTLIDNLFIMNFNNTLSHCHMLSEGLQQNISQEKLRVQWSLLHLDISNYVSSGVSALELFSDLPRYKSYIWIWTLIIFYVIWAI